MRHLLSDERSLVLFMSADVVGSTAFKARSGNANAWMEAFESFFRELPLIFVGQIAMQFFDQDEVPETGVWKVMGDEVVFAASPNSLDSARRITTAFCEAVASFDQRLSERWPLRIRGCCWAAEIGGRNRAIEIPEMLGGSDEHPYLDFLGPDIDTGFRLSAHSRSGGLIVSPNLAEALAAQGQQGDLQYHYLGEKSLKGVCAGMPFPLVLVSLPGMVASELPQTSAHELAAKLAQLRLQMQQEAGADPAPPVQFVD